MIISILSCKHGRNQQAMDAENQPSSRNDAWIQLQQQYAKWRKEGIVFFAEGTNPDWKLTVNKEGALAFVCHEQHDSIFTPSSERMLPKDARAEVFAAEVESGRIVTTIINDSCTFSKSNTTWPYKVRCIRDGDKIGFREYQGCGMYLNDPMLHNIWILHSWERKGRDTVKLEGERPRLELNLQQNTFYGFSGCRELQGTIAPKGNIIAFQRTNALDAACNRAEALEFERIFFYCEAKATCTGMELRLEIGDEVLEFRKGD